MKHGRVIYQGRQLAVTESSDGRVQLPDGKVVAETEVQWLPPMEFGTIFALGLNYADHAKEIAFNKAPEEPLVFLKGPNALNGHRGHTPPCRCELYALRVRAGRGDRQALSQCAKAGRIWRGRRLCDGQ